MQATPQTDSSFRSPVQRNTNLVSRTQSYFLPLDVSSRFGIRVRQLRRDRQLTQLRMANTFGIDRTFISDVERGRKSISLPMIEVLALGFQVSLSELLRDI